MQTLHVYEMLTQLMLLALLLSTETYKEFWSDSHKSTHQEKNEKKSAAVLNTYL